MMEGHRGAIGIGSGVHLEVSTDEELARHDGGMCLRKRLNLVNMKV